MNQQESFDLYSEAKYQYKLIVPEQVEGLILLSLYDQFGTNSFKEEHMNVTIDRVHRDLAIATSRTEYERNNAIIIKLQEFYLSRNDTLKEYEFKTFGIQFCDNIKERLVSIYNPAKIRRLFDGLLVDLKRYLITEGYNFDTWFADRFVATIPEITQHVEILEQQVSQSVREFRKKIKDEHEDIHILIDEILRRLDEIKEQANELKEAFGATYLIDTELEELMLRQQSDFDTNSINRVFVFNDTIRRKLEQISIRIDHIKPKIREFIYEFNQRDFDRKTALFIDFLLKRSKISKGDSGKRLICLPSKIPQFSIGDLFHLPRFYVVPTRKISRNLPPTAQTKNINLERQVEILEANKAKQRENSRVDYWIKYVKEQVLKDGFMNFSELFYEILLQENNKLKIPVKVTSKLVRELCKQQEYMISVNQELVTHTDFPNIKLWKMSIRKR
ncbi:hypothetical protein [Sphingobacterium anhuiense]|uniref:hypothetical protein n=1 Tax=Sphingobacterium anhuiense TaxID=493780 RepID=UPI003C2E2603